MEHALVHLAQTAAWVIFVTVLFAIVGVYATIRWIVGLITGAGRAVESGVHHVEHEIRHDLKE
jgi:hypothetical protein